MAYNAWVNIPLDAGTNTYLTGPLYRAWKAVTSLLNGAMTGKVSIVDCSAGTAGNNYTDTGWTGDASPADGAWMVLEWLNGWSTGEKMQVFIGVRLTTGNLAGFGSLGKNLYLACSPTGGWVHANLYFGSSLADWRNGGIAGCTDGGSSSTLTFNLFFHPGVAATRPGSIGFSLRDGANFQGLSGYAGALVPPAGCSDAKYRVGLLGRRAQNNTNGTYYWNNSAGITGSQRVPKATLDGWYSATTFGMRADHTNIDATSGGCFQQDVDGAWVNLPLPLWCSNTSRTHGFLQGLCMNSKVADGSLSLDGAWYFVGGIGWPREASRDASWI